MLALVVALSFCAYNQAMKLHYDPIKSARNEAERGLPFAAAAAFDFDSALYLVDERKEYGEIRYIAIGYLGARLHVLCFTEASDGIRVISFRKANEREAKRHGKTLTLD